MNMQKNLCMIGGDNNEFGVIEGAICGRALYEGAFTLEEALAVLC